LTLGELADALTVECDGDVRKALLVMSEHERLAKIAPPGTL
jgi:hypothetical protein